MGSFLNDINFSLRICNSDLGCPSNLRILDWVGAGSLKGSMCAVEVMVSTELIDSLSEQLPSVDPLIDGPGGLNSPFESS